VLEGTGRYRENVLRSCKKNVKRKEAATRDRMVVKEIVKRAEKKEAVWAGRGEREHPRPRTSRNTS